MVVGGAHTRVALGYVSAEGPWIVIFFITVLALEDPLGGYSIVVCPPVAFRLIVGATVCRIVGGAGRGLLASLGGLSIALRGSARPSFCLKLGFGFLDLWCL